ncbi:carbohydrate-binding protein [Cohnella sp.]|uniref:carbohydrate-binding protein n=1 Tax=Cohnella sp. TaxID=1883426 RepID=UPI00356A659F
MGTWRKGYQTRVLALFLAFLMIATFIPAGDVEGAGTLLKTGNYYYKPAPDGGNSPDKGATGLISSTNGVLFDGLTTTYAGWMGSATSQGTVQVVFDLLKDYPLESINVVLNSPNSFWGFKEFTVKYRPEAVTDFYYIAAKHIRSPGITSTSPSSTWNYSVNIPMSNKTARYIVIDIKRPHAFQHIPLTEVQIYKGTGQEGVNPGPALTVEQMALELKKDALMVDKYGQWVYETWDGKVTSDAQLQQEYTDEANLLSKVSLDPSKYDQYGGIKNGGHYTKTGFFRLQQIDNKWWFVTPDGYKFILKGVDATSIWEWGYGTPLKKADGTPKQVFEELPDPVAYAPAYVNDSNGERVSFVIANVMRKYGSDFESKWEDITKKRLIDWGFNAFSKWTRPTNVTFPYIQVLQDPGSLRRIQWTYDVFDPQSESIIETALTAQLEKAKNDPWLIGYTYDNEAGWSADIVKEVLTHNSTSPAKSAFVDFLAPRYNNDINAVNQLLGTSAESFTALKDTSINIAKVPAADVSEYIKLASRTYFSTIRSIIKKYDTNHLFLGASIVPTWRTSLDWDSAAMEFVDAFSVDNYTNSADWISRYETYGKPLLNLEYTFSTTERGLSPVNAATTVPSIADRGLAFKAFVESQIEHPLFVGSGYFSYYDQAVTGRKDGENFNIGLVNQQDQPYTDMVNILKTVNAGLENVHAYGIPVTYEAEDAVLSGPVTANQISGYTGTGYADYIQASGDYIEWTVKKNISETYELTFRYANGSNGDRPLRITVNGSVVNSSLSFPPTGGWSTWSTASATVSLNAGNNTIRATAIGSSGANVDSLTVKYTDLTPPWISIDGVENGQSYTDSVIPVVKADDAGSGLKSLDVKLNGVNWTTGTAITVKGEHTLIATAIDNTGNAATQTIRFTLYHGTQLQVEPAAGVLSDTTVLNAVLTDSFGQPVSGESVTFTVDGTVVGTAVTDEQGKAPLGYQVDVGAVPDADTLAHDLQAAFAQNDASHYRGSDGSSVLTVAKEGAAIEYMGSTVVSSDMELALAAKITQEDDGEPGSLAGLPVRFTVHRIHVDGTTSSVTSAVYGTDEAGNTSASVSLPAGLYEVKAEVLPNSYYKTAETSEVAAVYEPRTGMRMNGWLAIPSGSSGLSDKAKKLMIETDWQYGENDLLQGKLKLRAEPLGLQLETLAAEWMVITEDSHVYLQAVAQDKNGETYTIRIMAPTSSAAGGNAQTPVSVTIWQGRQTNGTALFQVFSQSFYGDIK